MICKDFPTAAIIKTKNLQKLQFVKKKSHHFQSFQHFFYIHIRFYQRDETKESKKKNICIITFDLSIIQTDSCIFQLIHHSIYGGVGFNQHCHKISTVLHHIGFRSTSLLLFTLNIFNISTVFTLNELSSPLFFHQHGFQSTLFSLNTAYHLH